MVNKVILIGNLGADPEVRYTQGGTAVANFNCATSETYTKDGERVTDTEWHKCVAFGRLGEVCGEIITKGSKVYLEGRLQTRQWEDKEGVKRYTTEIVLREMKKLDPRSANDSAGTPPEPDTGDPVPF